MKKIFDFLLYMIILYGVILFQFCKKQCEKSLNLRVKSCSQRADRPPDKSAYLKIIFLISQPKHML